jgi:lipoprotein LpqB-like beta-propeller protein
VKRLLAAFVAVASVLLLGGCTGVPSSSAPQTVEALDTDPATDIPSVPPPLNADPRTLVQSYLDANATDADGHNQARAYLTSAAQTRWSDATATVIADDFSVDTYHPSTHTVTVFGRRLGTLNAAGIYTPSLQGIGEGGSKVPFQFTISRAAGQNRIDQLPNGLLLTDQQFRDTFQQRVLYFYDVAEDFLVPDLRWSAIGDRTQLATWLLTQLATGPRPELQNAVSTDTLPAQADARHLTVTLGTPTRIEIPGSSQLDPGVRNRLAAQLGATLSLTVSGRAISITDGGTPVNIPQVQDDQFTASQFAAAKGPVLPDPAVYYLVGGRVYTEAGRPMSGPAGDGRYALTSLAVGRPHAGGPLLVAGAEGSGSSQRLLVGTQAGGLRQTKLRGALSRPAFAPGRSEVWIGDGSTLYRVTLAGAQAVVSRIPIPTVSGGGRVVAVRLSPDGSRVAMVVSGASASSAQLYIGSIVRGAGQVRVDTLEPISPEGVVLTDVAWNDPQRLFGIGYVASTQDARTFETGVDGTEWTNLGIGNLAVPPDSVTVATAANVWVSSANGYVWKQGGTGTQWVSPGRTGQTLGRAPVYLD